MCSELDFDLFVGPVEDQGTGAGITSEEYEGY